MAENKQEQYNKAFIWNDVIGVFCLFVVDHNLLIWVDFKIKLNKTLFCSEARKNVECSMCVPGGS